MHAARTLLRILAQQLSKRAQLSRGVEVMLASLIYAAILRRARRIAVV
jgi:hypothetical protein